MSDITVVMDSTGRPIAAYEDRSAAEQFVSAIAAETFAGLIYSTKTIPLHHDNRAAIG